MIYFKEEQRSSKIIKLCISNTKLQIKSFIILDFSLSNYKSP